MRNIIDYQNVNGIPLSLSIEANSECPRSRIFSISYKIKENKSIIPKVTLLLAILFNVLSIFYLRISLTSSLIIINTLAFLLFFWVCHCVQIESLVVIPSVGIQCSVKYVCGRQDKFVPWNTIDDIIINEVIEMNRVIYFLTILVKADSDSEEIKLIPLFKNTKPRLLMIQAIYTEFQSLLREQIIQIGSGDTG